MEPAEAVAGEPFRVQPKVAVYRDVDKDRIAEPYPDFSQRPDVPSDYQISVYFTGGVYALLSTSPTGNENLRIGWCNATNDCGPIIDNDLIARRFLVPFVDGIAIFQVYSRFCQHCCIKYINLQCL